MTHSEGVPLTRELLEALRAAWEERDQMRAVLTEIADYERFNNDDSTVYDMARRALTPPGEGAK